MPKIVSNGFSEAQASAVFFLKEDSRFNTAEYAAVVDIGGGTTDFSLWRLGNLVCEDSMKFAGSDLVEVSTDLVDYVNQITKGSQSVGGGLYDIAMRKWPCVTPGWDGYMESIRQEDFLSKTFRTVALFYSGICYYVGMHLRREGISDPLSNLAFAGNGTRFLEIVTGGQLLSEESLSEWTRLFRAVLSSSHGVGGEYNTTFVFSNRPKLEVALGLVSPSLERYRAEGNKTRKMLGLEVEDKSGRVLRVEDWDKNLKAKDFLEMKIDFTKLEEFIAVFQEAAVNDFGKWNIKEDLPKHFDDKMRRSLFHSLETRGDEELASSLFFEALRAYMKIQYSV